MTIDFTPKGVCSKNMKIEVEDGFVKSMTVTGGCAGNLQGLSNLIVGMPVEEVIARLDGIKCGMKKTSCPDQLAQALKKNT